MKTRKILSFLLAGAVAATALGSVRVIDDRLHHLRGKGEPHRWSDFPPVADADRLEVSFESRANTEAWTLWIRQYAVRGQRPIAINGRNVGRLSNDMRDMTLAIPIPPGTLVDGTNTLVIMAGGSPPNDMFIGQIRLVEQPVDKVLHEAQVQVLVTDARTGEPVPCRLTVVDDQGSLISVGGVSDERIAVRRGTVYTVDGTAQFGLPAGQYRIYAGRGFEYSVANARIDLSPGGRARVELSIERQVDTSAYVSIDSHVHSWDTFGDVSATPTERMITLAGEGLQLAMMTDHNLHMDYRDDARRTGADRFFTPIMGNEVTTRTTGLGHFNIFPVEFGAPVPDHAVGDWADLFDVMYDTPGVRVVVLNYGRNNQAGFRPLGAENFNTASGRRLDGRPVRFNAMEVVNSGATLTDPLDYVRDWMAMLNRGHAIVPVGGSDSHNVTRKFVGQARTYVAGDGRELRDIDVGALMDNLVSGQVLVSMGLLVRMTVDGRPPGYRVVARGPVKVDAVVEGPHWAAADQVLLFANGTLIRRVAIDPLAAEGTVKWSGSWTLDADGQDMHLVAVALGPGITAQWWKVPRPYQADSISWRPYVIGVTGAVYIDTDGNGQWTSPLEHARRLVDEHGKDLRGLLAELGRWDRATAIQAACLLEQSGMSPDSPELKEVLRDASQNVRAGFAVFEAAWRDSQAAARSPLRRALDGVIRTGGG
jgi:hypothetical protein